MRRVLPFAVLLLLGGCAFGNTLDYGKQTLALAAKTEKPVTLAVDDKRPYVVSGEHTPEFVGVIRSAVGIPYGVHTASHKPLADDFAAVIAAALKQNAISVTTVSLLISASGEAAAKALAAKGNPRSLLVTIKDWQSDKYFQSTLSYALQAEVRDASGAALATNGTQGSRQIQGDMMNPVGNLETGAVGAAQQAIRQLLDDPKIVGALK